MAPARLRRRLLLAATVALLLGAGYQLWLRDSSLVAVDEVTVTGLTTSDADRVRAALTSAGRSMTTLHVRRDDLERAVAGYPVVRELEVSVDFPHGMRVRVVEHHAAALAVGDGERVPVAGDGTILRGLPVGDKLPLVTLDGAPRGDRLKGRAVLGAAAVAGAAPLALRRRVSEVERRDEDGLVAELRDGPELVFGAAARLRAKWAAAARVLADPEAAGASYIDLRIPDRPAAGGLPAETVVPVAPASTPSAVAPTTLDSAATADPAAVTGASTVEAVPPATETTVPDPAATAPDPAGTTPPAVPAPETPPAPIEGGAGGGATAAPEP